MASENKKRKQKNSPFVPSAIKEKGTMRMKRQLYFTPSTRRKNNADAKKEVDNAD